MRLWGELAQVLVIAKCRECYSSFAMTKCATCGTNTHLYLSGVPICLACVRELDATRKPSEKTTVAGARAQAA